MALISIIIPVFNGEQTIRETINSVLAQTFKDFELIIIDDGSKDQTLKVVRSINDARIKVFSYPNANQAVSRNRGLSHAVGDFIAFLDADDLWTPDKLKVQLQALKENPQAALVYSWTNLIDEFGQFLRPGCLISAAGNVYKKLLLTNFLENGSNPLIRRQALETVGGFEAALTPAEDWDMYLRLAVHYPFVVVPSPQILYRVSNKSASTNVSRMEAACLRVIERALRQAPESMQHLKQQSLGNIYKYLTFKALNGTPIRESGIIAIKFLFLAIINEPSLSQKRVIFKVLLKSLIVILFPHVLARYLFEKIKHLANLETLLVHIKADLPSV